MIGSAETHPSKVLAGLYSASAPEYAQLWAPVLQPTSERLIAAMPLVGAATVLDLGTGTGALLPTLRAAAPNARVIGMDRATGMLREARARVPSAPLDLPSRRECLKRVGAAFAELPAEELVYRPEMLLAIATRA